MNAHEIYKAAIEHYGRETQMLVCIEEMAELIQAICKRLRGRNNRYNLAEEMADVEITQEQLRMMFPMESKLVSWIEPRKLERLEKRIAEDKARKKRVVVRRVRR